MTTTIVLPVFSEVTQLDFTAPHQVLSLIPDIQVIVASVGGAPVQSTGLSFNNLVDLESIERCDVLCVPGGMGCIDAMEEPRYLDAVRRLAGTAGYITSVCSGSLILGAAGLLKGKRAACHWAWREALPAFGATPEAGRVVRDGNIITGGGVTAGIDFALTLLAELRGPETAQAIQLMLEYAPQPPFNSGRPETAPAGIKDIVTMQMTAAFPGGRQRVSALAERLTASLSA